MDVVHISLISTATFYIATLDLERKLLVYNNVLGYMYEYQCTDLSLHRIFSFYTRHCILVIAYFPINTRQLCSEEEEKSNSDSVSKFRIIKYLVSNTDPVAPLRSTWVHFYRTQVNMGSDLWVWMSVTHSVQHLVET